MILYKDLSCLYVEQTTFIVLTFLMDHQEKILVHQGHYRTFEDDDCKCSIQLIENKAALIATFWYTH